MAMTMATTKSNSSRKAPNKPRYKGEPHLFNPLNCKKVRFFQWYYSQNSTKGTKSKAIQVSQIPGIESRPQTAAPVIS